MDIQKELAEANQKMNAVVSQINAIGIQQQRLEKQKQELFQEARRLEGEVRAFKRLEQEEKEASKSKR